MFSVIEWRKITETNLITEQDYVGDTGFIILMGLTKPDSVYNFRVPSYTLRISL